MKMEKTPRYTQRERNMVLGFAAQYKDVIENKRTDAESNRKKDEVWRQIAKEFNLRVYHQRSSKQLRQLYKNMKLLLKKDLCGEGKGNRSFMDLLNTLSQQESVAQYISEQMSPSGYSSSRQQKYDDEYDDSKLPSVSFDGMDTDVIVIKSEDISDNEQSQNGMDDDDDDDCLSPKDIPEVCLEEEDDEIFATDLRQPPLTQQQQQQQQLQNQRQNQHLQLSAQHQQTQQQQQQQQPEITIQNIGGIRVGSIGSLANLKALQNGNNSALSITHANGNSSSSNNNSASNNNSSGSSSSNNNHNNIANTSNSSSNNRQITAEQQAQHLLLNGLGLSAVHPPEPPLPTLHRGGGGGGVHSSNSHTNHHHHHLSNSTNQLLMNLNAANSYGHSKMKFGMMGNNHNVNHNNNINNNNNNLMNNQNNDYLISLAIEERKLKIDLIKAQIEYWKKMTKNLDSNGGYNPTPACPCHFPGKVNGLQTPTSSS